MIASAVVETPHKAKIGIGFGAVFVAIVSPAGGLTAGFVAQLALLGDPDFGPCPGLAEEK